MDALPTAQSSQRSQTTSPFQAELDDIVVEKRETLLSNINDVTRRFEDFQQLIAGSSALAEADRYQLLKRAFDTCCPTHKNDGRFSFLVFQHLLTHGWTHGHIVGCLSQQHVCLPHIYTSDGLEFLKSLKDMTTKALSSDKRIRGMSRMYEKLADTAQNIQNSTCTEQDTSLRLLIWGLWESACLHGEPTKTSVVNWLRVCAEKTFDQRLQKHLIPFVKASENDNGPAVSLVAACIRTPELLPTAVKVLEHIPPTLLREWIVSVPTEFAASRKTLKRERKTSDPTTIRSLQRFETWSKLLHSLDREATSTFGEATWSDLAFKHTAKIFMDRSLAVLPPHALVIVLLYALAGKKPYADDLSERLLEFIDSYAPELTKQHSMRLPINEMLTRLITQLEASSLPNHEVLELVIPFIYQYKGIKSVTDLLRRIVRGGSQLSQTSFLEAFIRKALDELSNLTASPSERNRQHHAFALKACQEFQRLTVTLGARTNAQASALRALKARLQFQHILDRANDARIVPLAYRKLTADLSEARRVHLVHQFAYQYSIDCTRTHRQKWRSIYFLYKYLQQNGLKMGPLFSRAVVMACIADPMSKNHFISARRLIWVCRLVAKVEGEEVARQVEHTAWLWRGDLILHAKKTMADCENRSRAHVSTMKRLGLI